MLNINSENIDCFSVAIDETRLPQSGGKPIKSDTRGRLLNPVAGCPCDTCPKIAICKRDNITCATFNKWVGTGQVDFYRSEVQQ